MHLVQGQYGIECTRGIGFTSIVTVLSPIATQNQQSVERIFLSPMIKILTIEARARGILFFCEPHETGTRLTEKKQN